MTASSSSFESPLPVCHQALLVPLSLRLTGEVVLPHEIGRNVWLDRFDPRVVDDANIKTISGLDGLGGHDVDEMRRCNAALLVAFAPGHGRPEEEANQDAYGGLNAMRIATGCCIGAEYVFVVHRDGATTKYAGRYSRDVPILGGERGQVIGPGKLRLLSKLFARAAEARTRYAAEEKAIRSRGGKYYPHVPIVRALQLHHVAIRAYFGEARAFLLTAALEAVVLAENGFASADFRKRVPILAGQVPVPVDERRLSYLYNLRSSIAHGSTLPTGVSKRDVDAVQELESLAERVLRRVLLDDEAFDVLGRPLDRSRAREGVRAYYAKYGDLTTQERIEILTDRFEKDRSALAADGDEAKDDEPAPTEKGADTVRSREFETCGLRFTQDALGRWDFHITDLPRLQERLGSDVLRDVLRCLLWADRIISMADLALLGKLRRDDSAASHATNRDVQAMFWFSCGCLKELSNALRSLGARNLAAQLTDDGQRAWAELTERRKRWETEVFTALRNSGGFHVDPDDFAKGLDLLASDRNAKVALSQGVGPHTGHGWFPLAHAAVVRGVWPEGGRVAVDSKLLAQVIADANGVGPLVERVLVGLLPELGTPEAS